ncbi:MAG: alpha/beta hydrolase [Pseudohongiellaceae bacterium]|nr:alpha/beta hydrolase [Pseudohongiellaceae bacterium]
MKNLYPSFARVATKIAVLGMLMLGMSTAYGGSILGVNCAVPPVWHCPDTNCSNGIVTQPGDTVDLETRRTYFLDCPSDYEQGDKVSIFMSLHGYGSFANWQRNYFPAMDVKDKYNLVVITPGSPVRYWSEADDKYLQNIIDNVVAAVGKENVEHFILGGHSQGGITSSRLVCTDYFKDKVDVRISMSGGRVGDVIQANKGFADGGSPVYRSGEPDARTAPESIGSFPTPAGPPGGPCDYSFIFAVGENEQIPTEDSPLADKYSCDERVLLPEVIDPKPGYVWDAGRQDPGTDGWGRYPKSGRAQVFVYPNCEDGRVVADVVKLQKGHTEGYEPNVTDKIIELALSAKGGKIANGSWTPPELPEPPRGPFGR